MLLDLVDRKAPISQFKPDRLEDLFWVTKTFGKDTPTLQKLLALESEGLKISDLRSFASRVGGAPDYIESLVETNQPVERFDFADMVNRYALSKVFGEDSPLIEKYLAFCKEGLDAELFASSMCWHQELLPAVEHMVADGVNLSKFSPTRLVNLARIYKALETDPELTKRIEPLQSAGLNIDELGSYLNFKPENGPQILNYIRNGFSARELSSANLNDIDQLTAVAKNLDATINPAEYLTGLQRKGLVGMKLAEYVRERPEQRQALVEQLIKGNADVRRFNDQMQLVAFPDNVASKLRIAQERME